MTTYKANKIKIEILPNDFPCCKKIVDIFQNHLWNHPFWIVPPDSPEPPGPPKPGHVLIPKFTLKRFVLGDSSFLPFLREIKIFMNSNLESEDHAEWIWRFNLVLSNINLWHCVKSKLLKQVSNPAEDNFPYETLKEKDFDFKEFSKFLNYEIGRIIDMVNPKFGYWKAFGYIGRFNEYINRPNKILAPKLGLYFEALWDAYISGRLSRKKVPLLYRKQEIFANLKSLYGYSNKKLFEKIWNSNSLTYDYLIEESKKAYRVGKLMGHIKY